MTAPTRSHAAYEEIFAEVEAPFAFVDLDAMRSNAEEMLGRAGREAGQGREQVGALPGRPRADPLRSTSASPA